MNVEQKEVFYMKIKELRQKINLSQNEMARRLGMPQTTLFNYEAGKNEPSIETLIKLADFFNVSIDELVGRESETINLKFLSDNEAYLIKKILKMNQLELAKTRAYVTGLTEE